MAVNDNEPSLAEAGRQVKGGGRTEAQAKIGVNVQEGNKVIGFFKNLRKEVQGLRKDLEGAAAASGQIQPGGGVRQATAQNGMPLFTSTTQQIQPGSATQQSGRMPSGGFGGGAFGGLRGIANQGPGPALIATSIIGSLAGSMVGGVAGRVDRAAQYASSADKLNVLTQQMTGMSQMAVMNYMRKPLANYRIGGQEGINQLMQFQSTTGYMATPQLARSIEGIRTMTGYSKSTADIIADQQAMLNPTVANRMFTELGGVNAYTTGGQMRDPMQLRQQMVKALGLTNDSILRGAQAPGSVTRYRMTQAGVPVEMQDELLQYAKEQQAYTKKGGQGMYDPSNPQHRKFMGIDENFATQQEETDKVKGRREEDFMRRQIDNMADLEKSNQQLIKALGSLEDKISGPIGAATGARPWIGAGGRLLQAGGLATMALTGWTGAGAAIGAGMMIGGTALSSASGSGDPVGATGGGGTAATVSRSSSANDANISIPYGYGGKRKSLTEVKSDPDFRKVDPRLQGRLLAMFRENPNVGIGDSFRDPGEQERMFKSRYRRTTKKTDIQWDGSYWEHVSGAPAAPPGRSFHEVGLASDLVGDLNWMNANAHRFGLKHFKSVNNEPWHVQLAELPNSRREWEKNGGGTLDPFLPEEMVDRSAFLPEDSVDAHGAGGGTGVRLGHLSGMSLSEIFASIQASVGGGSALSNRRRTGGNRTKASSAGSVSGTPITGGTLTGAEVATLAYQAGFRGQDLINMVAIAKRESGFRSTAYNGNLGTGDQSYGLWQINTLNGKGGRMGDLVNDILGLPHSNKNFDALFDPATNARVAYEFYKRNGNTLRPWGAYKGESNTYNTDVAAAAKYVQEANLRGDPMPSDMGPRGAASFVSNTKNNITFAPNVVIQGTSATPDLRRVAKEAVDILKQELELMEMRGA